MEANIKYSHTYNTFDILGEMLAALLLIANTTMIILSLNTLPDIIPNHFNAQGTANGYGSKYIICGPLVFSLILYAGLTVLSRFPQAFLSSMSKFNQEAQYKMTVKMIISLKPILMSVFFLISFFMIQTAQLKLTDYLKQLVVVILVLVFSHSIYWVVRYSKLK
jgi:uncharacterized membrane protein